MAGPRRPDAPYGHPALRSLHAGCASASCLRLPARPAPGNRPPRAIQRSRTTVPRLSDTSASAYKPPGASRGDDADHAEGRFLSWVMGGVIPFARAKGLPWQASSPVLAHGGFDGSTGQIRLNAPRAPLRARARPPGGAAGGRRAAKASRAMDGREAVKQDAPAWASEAVARPRHWGTLLGHTLNVGVTRIGRARSRGRPRCRAHRCRGPRSPRPAKLVARPGP